MIHYAYIRYILILFNLSVCYSLPIAINHNISNITHNSKSMIFDNILFYEFIIEYLSIFILLYFLIFYKLKFD
jgi:hypothetical protein